MSSVKFVLNKSGVRALLKSEEVSSVCKTYANSVFNGVSGTPGYKIEKRNYPERTGWAVYASDYPAVSENLKYNTLLKAVGK